MAVGRVGVRVTSWRKEGRYAVWWVLLAVHLVVVVGCSESYGFWVGQCGCVLEVALARSLRRGLGGVRAPGSVAPVLPACL